MESFKELVQHLSDLIGVTLHTDRIDACRFSVDGKLHVQIENEPSYERILIATFLGEVPPGKFRENVFKEALKANNFFPRVGILGFSNRKYQLALFDTLPYLNLTANKLGDFLSVFIEKAEMWRSSIQNGNLAPVTQNVPLSSKSIYEAKR